MSQASARWTLLAILALFLIPLVAAMLMWSGKMDWKPGGMRNHGTLVEPPRATGILDLQGAEGLADHWILLYQADTGCAETCIARLTDLRQVRRATGRHARRVRVVALVPVAMPAARRQAIQALDAELVVLTDPDGRISNALADTARSLPPRVGGAYLTWLLDPQALTVLAYNPATDAGDILKDVKRLLTWSKADNNE